MWHTHRGCISSGEITDSRSELRGAGRGLSQRHTTFGDKALRSEIHLAVPGPQVDALFEKNLDAADWTARVLALTSPIHLKGAASAVGARDRLRPWL